MQFFHRKSHFMLIIALLVTTTILTAGEVVKSTWRKHRGITGVKIVKVDSDSTAGEGKSLHCDIGGTPETARFRASGHTVWCNAVEYDDGSKKVFKDIPVPIHVPV